MSSLNRSSSSFFYFERFALVPPALAAPVSPARIGRDAIDADAGAEDTGREPGKGERMSGHWRTRTLAALAAPLLAAATVTFPAPAGAAAASCENWTGLLPPSPGDSDGLSGVNAVS